MKTQHEDLTAAQAELEKIILELDTGMRRQFKVKNFQRSALSLTGCLRNSSAEDGGLWSFWRMRIF